MENEPASVAPGVSPPPPKLNLKQLWLALLLPPAVLTLFMVWFNVFPKMIDGPNGDMAFTILCVFVCLATIVGWVLFSLCLLVRFRGASLVLLILAYPIFQAVLLFAIFFVGCLAIFSQVGGFH